MSVKLYNDVIHFMPSVLVFSSVIKYQFIKDSLMFNVQNYILTLLFKLFRNSMYFLSVILIKSK